MNLKDVNKGTWIRTVVLVVALINQALQMFGVETLPFTGEEVADGITMVLTIISTILAWWKNNSFTMSAQQADKIMKEEK